MKTLTTLFSMSIFVIVTLVLVITAVANADVYVRGYSRGNGTYVQPHYRSNPDGIRSNNWSTRGNVNPYTGKIGTRRLSNFGGSNIPAYRKPSTMPYLPDNGSRWSEPSPLPYNPIIDSRRPSLL